MFDLTGRSFIGVVADNKDPKKLGRCRVRVVNIFDLIPVEDIPWATPRKDVNGNYFNVPEVGKIVNVYFDEGNIYKPEFTSAEHYSARLEEKLKKLSQDAPSSDVLDDYTSMKALLFDSSTQIYVNESEGLKIDHKYQSIHLEPSSITLNLKDRNSTLNLGDSCTDQPIILGRNFMEWFDKFIRKLTFNPYWSSISGASVIPQNGLADVLLEYAELRDTKFLSHHIKAVDNSEVDTVAQTSNSFPVHRENLGQAGDYIKSLDKLYKLSRKLKDIPKPWKKRKKRFDVKYKPPQQKRPIDGVQTQQGLPQSSGPVQNTSNPDAAKPSDGINNSYNSPANQDQSNRYDPNINVEFYEDDDETAKILRFLQSKSGTSPITGKTEDYFVFEDPYILNIVVFRSREHEYGTVTNRYDDRMWVFYKDDKDQWSTIKKYSVTTMPGWKVVDGKKTEPPILPENVCFINYGQYLNSYQLGYHSPEDYGKRHPALICDKVGIRMNKSKGKYSLTKYVNTGLNTQIGIDVDGWVYETGINIHGAIPLDESVYGENGFTKAGIVFDEVNSWSMGCIVFNNPNQYRLFLGLCQEQKNKGKKSQFTVTVASYREFELFETDSLFEDEDSEKDSSEFEDRFPDFDEDDDY